MNIRHWLALALLAACTVQAQEATTIRTLIDAGFDPESVKSAVAANDWALLRHSGLYSVQLQSPGAQQPVPAA